MSGLYCTHIFQTGGGLDMPCTRETERFYRVRDKDGVEVDFGLCESCAGHLCPPGGSVDCEVEMG